MSTAAEMFKSHPCRPERDLEIIVSAHDALLSCLDSCRMCADACLAEDRVTELRRCIRLNLDCADICHTTLGLLSRMTEPDGTLLRAQVEACAEACRVCGEECMNHARMYEHCRVCGEDCRRCERACRGILTSLRQKLHRAA